MAIHYVVADGGHRGFPPCRLSLIHFFGEQRNEWTRARRGMYWSTFFV